jgi:hypothetical protein
VTISANNYITWTFDTPIELDPNTLYGFDVDVAANGFISRGNSDNNSYTGGQAFSNGSGGTPNHNSLTFHGFDRTFHLDMEAVGMAWSSPGSSNALPETVDVYATLEGTNATSGYLYWDTTDKGETNSAWAYTNTLGSLSTGLVERTVSNLSHGVTYFARFYGTNSTVTNFAWSDAFSFTSQLVIANSAATGLTSTSATFNATLHAPNTNYDVVVYWGANDGGAAEGSWANTNNVGSYASVSSTNLEFTVNSLTQDTEYHYTFRATNANDSFWATPSVTFSTISQPVVNNGSGATPAVGYATLNGNLTDGTIADIYVYWGTFDEGTNATTWANTNMLGQLGESAFSTNATALLYGETYYYRCYATNALGEDWADSTESFTTDMPVIPNYTNGLYEWFFSNQGSDSQLDPIDAPTGWLTPPWSPDAIGVLDEELAGNAGWAQGRALSAAIQPGSIDGNPGAVWFGKLQIGASGSGAPLEAGDITLASNSDDGSTVWVDRDQDGDFSHSGASGDEMVVDNKGNHGNQWRYGDINLAAGVYDVAIGWRDNGGGNWIEAKWYQGVTANQGVMTRIDPSNAGQDGLWQYLLGYITPGITNTAASSLTTTSATLNATLEAPGSMFDVYVYWGTNDGGAAEGAWGNTNLLGTYTDVVSTNLEFAVANLSQSTEYHYTFEARNDATNIWAAPSTTFTTVGQPGIDNATGATPTIGYATLNGNLTNGSLAYVTVYWGTDDGGTNAADWANTNSLGELAEGAFSTNTSDLLYGVTYYYRCYATNSVGEHWADSTTNFTTLFPGPVYTNALRMYGYHINNDSLVMDLNNNGGMMGGGDPTTGPSYYGQAFLTSGPGGRGLDFDNDGDFQGTGTINQNDNYSDMFLGYFLPAETGTFGFRNAGDDDAAGIWFDLDRDGIFESSVPGLGDNRGEQLSWENGGNKQVTLTNGLEYLVAFTHREGTGGSRCDFRFTTPSLSERIIKPADPVQEGMWRSYVVTHTVSITNAAVTSLTTTSATFNAELNATGSVFDVYVYWGTSDGSNNAAAWGNTNYIGSYTNIASTNLDFSANGLTLGGEYYYTFTAQNQLTNLWASPSITFQTVHQPAVNNSAGAVTDIGSATLFGELTDGSEADITVYWGATDGSTNAADWANTNVVGTSSEATFSTGTPTNLLYGVTYFYRCYASNTVGDAWADTTESFTTLFPHVTVYSNALRVYGYHYRNDGEALDLHGNGGMMGGGDPTTFTNFYGEALLTTGPADRGLDFNGDGDFQSLGVIGTNDNYSTLFVGYLHAFTDGYYQFQREADDDAMGIWLDVDQDGVFESSVLGLGSDRGEQLQWDGDGNIKTRELTAGDYMFAATHAEGTAGSQIDVNFMAPSMSAFETIKPTTDPAQVGMWVLITGTNSASIANTAVSSLTITSATFNGVLNATGSVFDVYVYWGDNDGGAAEESWGNTNYIGSYTNSLSNDLGFVTSDLVQGTEYHYTFLAQNDATNMWATPSMTFTTGTVIANSPATDLSTTSAVCNAVLKAPVNDYDVYLLWGGSDGGAADGAWANTNFVGSYTNVASTNISFAIGGLTNSTPYYYTFRATEGSYTAWGHPSTRFYTHGLPDVQNLGAVTGVGYATLNGGLLSAGGAPTTVHVYWGETNEGTNRTDWANTNIVGSPVEGVPFSTSTTSNLLFGQQYYFRCYATNSNGVAWAESSANFLVGAVTSIGTGGMIGPGSDITSAGQQDTPNQERLNVDRTVYTNLADGTYNVDDFRLNVFDHNQGGTITPMLLSGAPSSYTTLWVGSAFDPTSIGDQTVPESGSFTLAVATDVYAGFFTAGSGSGIIALDQNNVGSGNSQTDHDTAFTAPTGPGETVTDFSNPNLSRTYAFEINVSDTAGVSIENTAPTENHPNYTMTGTLDATQAVFTVTLYWGTVDKGNTTVGWDHVNSIGAFTNTNSVPLTFTTNGLAPGTEYHYRFLATNAATNMWATPSANFTTVGPEYLLPFVETFEDRTLGDLDGQYGWVAADTEVQGSVTHLASAKAACLDTNRTAAMSHTFADGQTDVWTDFFAKLVFGDPAGAGTPSEDSTTAFFVNTNGQVVVYDGTNLAELTHSPLVEGDDWVRFTVHSDYTDQEWDLYLDGQPVGLALDFYSTNSTSYGTFGVMNTGTNNAYIDDINIQLTPPPFAGGTVILVR